MDLEPLERHTAAFVDRRRVLRLKALNFFQNELSRPKPSQFNSTIAYP